MATDHALAGDAAFLAPGRFVDSDHPEVIAFARSVCEGATSDKERAARLFAAVRDRLRYDPYSVSTNPEDYRASAVLRRERAYCIPKAVLFCAAARAVAIPARLGFADVKNHLASEKLRRTMGTDLFAYHGYVEIWIDGRPVKATPAFDAALCARFGVPPLELDGVHDAMLQAFDGQGRRYMEYVRDRGLHLDLPLDDILATFASVYGGERPKEDDPAFE
jgi:transglutaminase-like putative cysteine protease